jgi:hypothetical protein
MIAPPTPAKAKTTFQSLSKIPGVTGLYRHDNGSYYGKKKVRGVKKVAPLRTTGGENIFDRKIAEAALKSWSVALETPSLSDGKEDARRMVFQAQRALDRQGQGHGG